MSLPAKGRLLDVGCGNGALLRTFGPAFEKWTLVGVETHEHLRSVIESIPGVEALFTCPIHELPGRFPLITLIHVLEHIPSPNDFLGSIAEKLDASGLLLIQVPDCEQNPFMFLVADHASHFFLPVLKKMVEGAGYDIVLAANDWVAKELTLIARKGRNDPESSKPLHKGKNDAPIVKRSLEWLGSLVGSARRISAQKPFGIFGTSIAATWLFEELGGNVDFFVDEDPNRPGNTCFDRPIYAPSAIPIGAHIFIALPPMVANNIRDRMESLALNARFYTPDPI